MEEEEKDADEEMKGGRARSLQERTKEHSMPVNDADEGLYGDGDTCIAVVTLHIISVRLQLVPSELTESKP